MNAAFGAQPTITMDFANAEDFQVQHYAFKVSESELDGILARIEAAGVAYGSHYMTPADGKLNSSRGGRQIPRPSPTTWDKHKALN